ncbi:MAG TPA: cell division protein FtsH [Oscillatoriales bacterium UBA8482]|nr:cell division protein FtsH [Oscillatoriales bacterium UBA8482]
MSIKKRPKLPNSQKIIQILLVSAGVILIGNWLLPQLTRPRFPKVPYSYFIQQVESGKVAEVLVRENEILFKIKAENQQPETILSTNPVIDLELPKRLEAKGVAFGASPPPQQSWVNVLLNWVIPPLILVAAFQYFMKRDPQGALSINKSKAKVFVKGQTDNITFADVAGVDEAKTELAEIVDFLKSPQRFTEIGAKIPKGVLLVGPPGTGKTLLGKAVAGEAGVPFFSISGSEFIELFVGTGAARVRDLFEQAKKKAPCIIFIDELDAIGKSRSSGSFQSGSSDEREQTLNQLLTEMDGFKENKGVIVVGATNRVDILDAALLRPGRFDRQITVGLPDRLGRIGILKVHARNKPFDEDVSLVQLANRTPGFSGADLANLLNESAILATRYKKNTITKNEVNEAADRIIGGIAGATMEDTKNKKLIAYHEVGHAIVGSVLENHDQVEKITLIPRGGAKGLTWFTPDEDQGLVSRSQLLARIITTLAGRVTEQIVFGDPEITTGASNDLQQVTNIARQMVTRYGMSNIGPIALEDDNNEQMFMGGESNDAIADRIDTEVCKIINHCEQIAKEIILDNRVIIDLAVEKLLDAETIDGTEFRKLVSEYTILPSKMN